MKNTVDLVISAVVAVVGWFAYQHLGVIAALGILIVAMIIFIWWNTHYREGKDE